MGEKKTAGKRSIRIQRIENKESRLVTFSKRKSGLWKKGSEIAVLCRVRIALLAISEAGKVFAFGSPSVDAVLGGDAGAVPADDGAGWEAVEALYRETEGKVREVAAESARMDAVGEKVRQAQAQAGKRFWFEVDVEALGAEELPVFAMALQRLRENVGRRIEFCLHSAAAAKVGQNRAPFS
ncbi:hypothetical protein BRADI_2g30530v3 [Brachypodium distachyon]|nr:hypothetical protein BRADI_2g30530v3 [Brachypodium distachyon]